MVGYVLVVELVGREGRKRVVKLLVSGKGCNAVNVKHMVETLDNVDVLVGYYTVSVAGGGYRAGMICRVDQF
jgi:hypothetical protein